MWIAVIFNARPLDSRSAGWLAAVQAQLIDNNLGVARICFALQPFGCPLDRTVDHGNLFVVLPVGPHLCTDFDIVLALHDGCALGEFIIVSGKCGITSVDNTSDSSLRVPKYARR